ncbi:histidine kinase [Microbacterium lacus]|uniref:sensor histidine kinase n=1 Tax=Microbacterium lacus TaxID=415217 RepID=UPI00384F28FE
MPAQPQFVPGTGVPPAEDELRLPRPPGVIRRFWSRHPLLADILIAVVALLLTLPAIFVRGPVPDPVSGWSVAAGFALSTLGCAALVWRRRWPIGVFVISLLPFLGADPTPGAAMGGPAALIALYSIAVYRTARACWIAFGAASALIATQTLVRILLDSSSWGMQVNVDVSAIVLLLIGALVGVNVGNRRRYLDALIERSRQLLIERDQQARLAAAAERTRIAREMHDIVSHSLTVVVALAEGATATDDAARASEATRAIARTARVALAEMRVMLGVLRDDDSLVPLAPLGQVSVHDVVAQARATGAPVTLNVTGVADVTPAVALALVRIVKEGLTNAIRYSRRPSTIRVSVVYGAAGTQVSIENDGAVPDAPSEGAGLGLRGLQERVDHVGGTMDAGSPASGTWRLRAWMPGRDDRDD